MSIPILSKKPDKAITFVAFKNGTSREYQGFSSRFSHISSLGRGGGQLLIEQVKGQKLKVRSSKSFTSLHRVSRKMKKWADVQN